MKKIILFSRYSKPAIKAGGPIKSIENIVKIYGDKYNFLLVTGDRDIDQKVFKNTTFNKILKKGRLKKIYLKKNKQNFNEYMKILNNFNPDVIYLNSFFDFKFSILICLINKYFIKKKLIISPRGELLLDALRIKYFRKKLYIIISNFLKLYLDTTFHLNSIKEKNQTKREIGLKSKFKVFPVFYPTQKKVDYKQLNYDRKKLKILFVSRIIKNKNLDFCLKVLEKIDFECEFNIVGEIEDKVYWKYCTKLVKNLNDNIKVNYLGTKKRDQVFSLMRKSHCLFHPSKFESFGHVIFESLLNGLPVIISKNTPWQNLKGKKVGFDLSLDEEEKFISYISFFNSCIDKVYIKYRKSSLNYANKIMLKNRLFFKKKIF